MGRRRCELWLGSATGTRYEEVMTEEERKAEAADAARRFEQATKDIAAEGRFGGPDAASTEVEPMEEALSLTDAVKKALPRIREMGAG